MSKNTSSVNYLLLSLIAIIWGSQYALNNIALRSFTPIDIACLRAVIGAITLAICTMLFKTKKPAPATTAAPKKVWHLYLLIALFESVIPLFLTAWGLTMVTSGTAAILMGLAPIFTLLVASLIFGQERLRVSMILSVILGFSGIVVLSLPQTSGGSSSVIGEIALIMSAFSFSLSMVLMKYLPPHSPVGQMRNILFIAAIPLVIVALIDNHWQAPELSAVIAMIVLGTFCTGIVYVMFMVLIQRTTSTFASLTNYLIPLVGVVIGTLFMGEKILLNEIIALVMIIGALLVTRIKR